VNVKRAACLPSDKQLKEVEEISYDTIQKLFCEYDEQNILSFIQYTLSAAELKAA